jgi:hypothetical protein
MWAGMKWSPNDEIDDAPSRRQQSKTHHTNRLLDPTKKQPRDRSGRFSAAACAAATTPFGLPPTGFKRFGESFRRRVAIAEFHDILNLEPIDYGAIEPQPEPATWTYIGGNIETLWVTRCTIHVLAERSLAADGDNSIAVMVVQIICEHPAAHPKVSVIASNTTLGLWQCEADPREFAKAGGCGFASHSDTHA